MDTVEPFLAHLASRSTSDERTPMLWGELADFRLFFLHLHWDSWVHERDMLLPLGIDHEPDAESLRFATAYGLLIAGVAVRMNGGQIEVPLDIGDLGPARLSVTADAVAVDIGAAAESSDAYTARDAATLVDALGGRGNVADALECPSNVGAELSLIGAFLHG